MAQNLNEIIRLPIDLSCLSDRLIHRLACLTPPHVLCGVRDKKDKLLSKLYKRRLGEYEVWCMVYGVWCMEYYSFVCMCMLEWNWTLAARPARTRSRVSLLVSLAAGKLVCHILT
ncbi:hypothetical protein EON65_18565 [archaeon]|nr:MAG: hypothetical protein EON65_18565 [archaeon]